MAKIGQNMQCISCKRFLTRRTQEQLKAEAKKLGWKMVKPDGWICPACFPKWQRA
jgi:hypothetical protein